MWVWATTGVTPNNCPAAVEWNHMTIDERLDALVQTVELMAHFQQDAEKRHDEAWRKILEAQRQNVEAQRRNEEAIAKTQVMIVDMVESIDSLSRVAHLHEQRISRLEDNQT
jgi:hypothetical protein